MRCNWCFMRCYWYNNTLFSLLNGAHEDFTSDTQCDLVSRGFLMNNESPSSSTYSSTWIKYLNCSTLHSSAMVLSSPWWARLSCEDLRPQLLQYISVKILGMFLIPWLNPGPDCRSSSGLPFSLSPSLSLSYMCLRVHTTQLRDEARNQRQTGADFIENVVLREPKDCRIGPECYRPLVF